MCEVSIENPFVIPLVIVKIRLNCLNYLVTFSCNSYSFANVINKSNTPIKGFIAV